VSTCINYTYASSEEVFYQIKKKYKNYLVYLKFRPLPGWTGTEEEIIFSRALAKYQDIVIVEE
jgi:hypothetical protein